MVPLIQGERVDVPQLFSSTSIDREVWCITLFFPSQCVPHLYCNKVHPIDIGLYTHHQGKVQSAQIIILCFSCFHKTSITKLKVCADIPCAKFQGTKFS